MKKKKNKPNNNTWKSHAIMALYYIKKMKGCVYMKKVLIVDDAKFMRLIIKNILEKNNFVIAGEAGDGIEAVNQYKVLKPDIVTMDITMPKMSGIEAVQKITEYDPNALIVMVTAMGQASDVKESIANGAKSFIIKPFDEDIVITTLNKLLETN